jgi:hypothetical protein
VYWFPIHVGDKWTYKHETRNDAGRGRAHPEIRRWKTEETTVGSESIPEGTLVVRRIRTLDPPPASAAKQEDQTAYLIRGDCLYMFRGVDWKHLGHQLTPALREDLLAGHIAADFCFPLAVGKTWGAPHWAEWRVPADAKDWRVAGIKARDPSAPDKQKMYHITAMSSYLGSGMTADLWFEKGVGIVREEEIHHGTIGEARMRLLRFEPASRP